MKEEVGVVDNRVTKGEFRELITTMCGEMPGENTFEFFVDYIENCIEVSCSFTIMVTGTIPLLLRYQNCWENDQRFSTN